MTIRTCILSLLLTINAATAQNRPVTINPIGDGSFHTATGADSTTHTIYTPDRGQTFWGLMPQGEITKEQELIALRQDLSAPLEPPFPFRRLRFIKN